MRQETEKEREREQERRVRICGKFVAWEMQIAIAELSERTISMALIKQARFELISKWATPRTPLLYSPTATRCHNRLTKKCTAYAEKKEPRPLFPVPPQTTWLNDVNSIQDRIANERIKRVAVKRNLRLRVRVATSRTP